VGYVRLEIVGLMARASAQVARELETMPAKPTDEVDRRPCFPHGALLA